MIAVEDGIISSISTYNVKLRGAGSIYNYMHLNMARLAVTAGQSVKAGDLIGYVSNDFGGTPTTIHLHFEIMQNTGGEVWSHVPPYLSLVAAYERRQNGPGEMLEPQVGVASAEPVFVTRRLRDHRVGERLRFARRPRTAHPERSHGSRCAVLPSFDFAQDERSVSCSATSTASPKSPARRVRRCDAQHARYRARKSCPPIAGIRRRGNRLDQALGVVVGAGEFHLHLRQQAHFVFRAPQTSVLPCWRPWPRTSVTVRPVAPFGDRLDHGVELHWV